MGEAKKRSAAAVQEALVTLGVEAIGGRVQVRWNQGEAATPFGQMAYFAEFLNLTGLYRRWIESCPLRLASPNGSKIADVLGTLFLSVLSGHWRYAHIAALRADAVSAAVLGMDTVVSEDTVRRALMAMEEAAGMSWLQEHLDASVLPLLSAPWILDTDVTVKPLYGKQEGAVIGYNPHKPGRPSHAYHTYQMAGLRLMLGVTVAPGNKSHANTTLPGLIELIEGLPGEKRPALVRGDCGQGGEPTMAALEARAMRYLFKLRLTKNVKRYIERMCASPEWTDAGQGWQGPGGNPSAQRLESSPAHCRSASCAAGRSAAHRRAATESGLRRERRPGEGLRVRRAGHGSGLRNSRHRATLPGPGRRGECLR